MVLGCGSQNGSDLIGVPEPCIEKLELKYKFRQMCYMLSVILFPSLSLLAIQWSLYSIVSVTNGSNSLGNKSYNFQIDGDGTSM